MDRRELYIRKRKRENNLQSNLKRSYKRSLKHDDSLQDTLQIPEYLLKEVEEDADSPFRNLKEPSATSSNKKKRTEATAPSKEETNPNLIPLNSTPKVPSSATTYTRPNPFKAAQAENERKQREKQEEIERKQKEREEKERAKKEYEHLRKERKKVLSKKTKRGQPVLSGQIDVILGKLRKGV
ncbi:hypothetical protein HDV05_008279 [Chytridiales sp. JEL 0842]|nr:hypothetical protein HDV05_008279 [Chytridiales sp. JEL 0842]